MAEPSSRFQSIFSDKNPKKNKQAPEEFRDAAVSDPSTGQPDLKSLADTAESAAEPSPFQGLTDWDVAIRYHELKRRFRRAEAAGDQKWERELRAISGAAVLRRAKQVLGSVSRPMRQLADGLDRIPPGAQEIELNLDETLEQFPRTPVMDFKLRRRHPLVICVDTSLSMTGEKLALTAVALAVVLLQFPDEKIGLVAFENEAKVLKSPAEKITVQDMVLRFLDVPAEGYTHLESGIREAHRLVELIRAQSENGQASTVLLTDGKYTAGRDPTFMAPWFPRLFVVKMGSDRSSLELCRELARLGHGQLLEVRKLEALPQVMYRVVQGLLRARI
ncbi:MAG: VWA domain-containing protein [Bacteriovoracia bacterium]